MIDENKSDVKLAVAPAETGIEGAPAGAGDSGASTQPPVATAPEPTRKPERKTKGAPRNFFSRLVSRSGRIPLSKTDGSFFSAPRVEATAQTSVAPGIPASAEPAPVAEDFSFWGTIAKAFVRGFYGYRRGKLQSKIEPAVGKPEAKALCAELAIPDSELETFAGACVELARKYNASSEYGPELIVASGIFNIEMAWRAGMGRIEIALEKIVEASRKKEKPEPKEKTQWEATVEEVIKESPVTQKEIV